MFIKSFAEDRNGRRTLILDEGVIKILSNIMQEKQN